jgi:hypothetical protein
MYTWLVGHDAATCASLRDVFAKIFSYNFESIKRDLLSIFVETYTKEGELYIWILKAISFFGIIHKNLLFDSVNLALIIILKIIKIVSYFSKDSLWSSYGLCVKNRFLG